MHVKEHFLPNVLNKIIIMKMTSSKIVIDNYWIQIYTHYNK